MGTRECGPVVYYIMKAGVIKIGYTADLHSRMNALRPDRVLAVEPGSTDLELRRHHQFRVDWIIDGVAGREWFEPSESLMRHIRDLVARHGEPIIPSQKKPRRARRPRRATGHFPEFEGMRDEEVVAYARDALAAARGGRGDVEGQATAKLHDEFGWTLARIADEMGYAVSTASRIVKRGRESLKASS